MTHSKDASQTFGHLLLHPVGSRSTVLPSERINRGNGLPLASIVAHRANQGSCPQGCPTASPVKPWTRCALSARSTVLPGGPPDFDADGIVGIIDLLALLANWGACA